MGLHKRSVDETTVIALYTKIIRYDYQITGGFVEIYVKVWLREQNMTVSSMFSFVS